MCAVLSVRNSHPMLRRNHFTSQQIRALAVYQLALQSQNNIPSYI